MFEKDSDASDGSGSDNEKEFDMFSDHKTLISKFTLNTQISSQDNDEANRSRILRKNLQTAEKIDEKKSTESNMLSKGSLQSAREAMPDIPIEKKLKIDDAVVEVVSRRANRGAIQSTEVLQATKNSVNIIQVSDKAEDLGLKINRGI